MTAIHEDKDRRKARAAMLSVASNASLVLLKLAVGATIGSVAVISEAIHSAVDLLASLIAFVAVKTSGKPADRGHPFGHGKVENISGTLEALLIFIAAGWIILEATEKLRDPAPMESVGWGVGVMLLSSLANIAVSRHLFKVGRETESIALVADAWHLRTDVYTSAGVMAGLALMWTGAIVAPNVYLGWLDPFSAILVALLIIRAALALTLASGRDLLDTSLPPEEEAVIRQCIASMFPAIKGFNKLRTRKAGSQRFVNFDLLVDGGLSVEEAHRLADAITKKIKARYPETTVTIHIEPFIENYMGECSDCMAGGTS